MGEPAELDALLQQLRQDGARVTTARRLVLTELAAAPEGHPTAEELAERIQVGHPDVHLSTVYRTLEFLEGTGLVFRAGFGAGATTYHLARDRHHHAVCDECGAVIVLPDRAFDAVADRLRRDHGFRAEPRHLTIIGRCSACLDQPSS